MAKGFCWMKYGILGDIHSNLEALEAVLAYLKDKVDRYCSVGDLVGYAADPDRCVDIVQKLDCLTVAGNHDYAVLGKTDTVDFNKYAKIAIDWTKDNIQWVSAEYLRSLDLTAKTENFSLAHSSLYKPEDWTYILSNESAELNFSVQDTRICFIGHSHHPCVIRNDGEYTQLSFGTYNFEKGYKYLVNAGSIGQPRDGVSDACALIYDEDKSMVVMERIGYNIRETQEKIIKAGLPLFLAERLMFGR